MKSPRAVLVDTDFLYVIVLASHKEEPEETRTTSPNLKQVSFVVPILDESKLIIEEIGMGSANGPKAQLGSKVIPLF